MTLRIRVLCPASFTACKAGLGCSVRVENDVVIGRVFSPRLRYVSVCIDLGLSSVDALVEVVLLQSLPGRHR